MKILIRNSDSVVLYADDSMVLGSELTGEGWVDPNINTLNSTIENTNIPTGWAGGEWSYSGEVWTNIIPPEPPTFAQLETAIQSQLDTYAQSWGYNDIATACTYVGSTVPKFSNEGTALRNWRDSTWLSAETLVASIQAGTAQMPATINAALSLMPVEPTRPS